MSSICDATATHCITCSDEGVPMEVVSRAGRLECRDQDGALHAVELELVAPVLDGDRVLVHAGVAIGRL